MEINQPNRIKQKMTGSKLSDVYCQGALKQKDVKQMGVKVGLGVFLCQPWHNQTAENYKDGNQFPSRHVPDR
jgi:hypothetical protein